MPASYSTATVTITAGTLASASARESAAQTTDTSSNVNDIRVIVSAGIGGGVLAGNKAVYLWIATSEDAGTTWTGNATGSDAAITLDSPNQFNLGGAIAFAAQSTTRGASFSLKAACGGSLPAKWSVIVENQTGIALSSCTVKAVTEAIT